MEERVILALGGSLMYDGATIDRDWLSAVGELLAEKVTANMRLGIVVGGGHLARTNIAAARKSGVTDTFDLDLVGIEATRHNAGQLIAELESLGIDVASSIPTATDSAASALEESAVVVMGGTVPGHTTDAVAVSLARDCAATKCVIATNVDYIYDKAPQQNPDAIPFERMTLTDLQGIVGPPEHRGAGPNVVVDAIAVQVAIDNSIELALLNGNKLQELSNALSGTSFRGTIVEVSQ